jgi:hypothetical protein
MWIAGMLMRDHNFPLLGKYPFRLNNPPPPPSVRSEPTYRASPVGMYADSLPTLAALGTSQRKPRTMQRILALFTTRHDHHQALQLTQFGKRITVIIQASETQDDLAHAATPEPRYLHHISATWTEPQSGRTYEFHHEFRSWHPIDYRIGDMVQVLLDPQNYRHYLMQTR